MCLWCRRGHAADQARSRPEHEGTTTSYARLSLTEFGCVTTQSALHRTPLLEASMAGQLRVVGRLVEGGAEINCQAAALTIAPERC